MPDPKLEMADISEKEIDLRVSSSSLKMQASKQGIIIMVSL